jgi:hypothetical protein
MQPREELLDGLTGPVIDIIAPTLIVEHGGKRKTIVIVEDHVHQDETGYTMGKSTIVQGLLNIPFVDSVARRKYGINEGGRVSTDELNQRIDQLIFEADDGLDIHQETATPVHLLAGDVTFIGKSAQGRLIALPMVGTKEDFIFDMARSAIRRLITDYNRTDDNIMRAQIKICEKIRLSSSVWADVNASYPVDEIICLTPDSRLLTPVAWGADFDSPESIQAELQAQLSENPTYIAGEIGYWDIDQAVHARQVGELLSEPLSFLPRVRYLRLRDPKNAGVLESATDLLRKEFEEGDVR